MTLKTDIAKAQSQIKSAGEQKVPGSEAPNVTPARSYPSPTAAYEENAMFAEPYARTSVTFRPMWRIERTAIQSTKVITTALPQATSATGIVVSPATTSANLVAIPDMTIPAQAIGVQLQISWNISASLSNAAATASFAMFRDGIKIGQTQYGNSPIAGQKFSVTQTILDNPSLGLHSYSVYWATTAGTLSADQKSRSISALVLRPQ